ncbi:hypothetical protein PENSPDRAFT_645854 [Peniophora sp. CONT]|nr:hypothetical protein PENSPDRAFT_645854 [Peniophora sp. CONT]
MPAHDVSYAAATLIGYWVAAVIYGINVPLYVFCLRVLGKEITASKRVLLIATSVHVLVATANICVTLAHLIEGFLRSPAPNLFYSDTSQPLYLAQLWTYYSLLAIGDCILAWRCYVVWKRYPAIGIYLVLCLLTYIVSAIIALIKIGNTHTQAEFFNAYIWSTVALSMSLGIQVPATILAVLKIWTTTVQRAETPTRSSNLAIISMMIESGIVLTSASGVVFTLYRLRFVAGGLVAPIHAQMSFLIPASITARTGLRQLVHKDRVFPGIRSTRPDFLGLRHDESFGTSIPLSPTSKGTKTSANIVSEAYGDNVYSNDVVSTPLGEYRSIAASKTAHAMT